MLGHGARATYVSRSPVWRAAPHRGLHHLQQQAARKGFWRPDVQTACLCMDACAQGSLARLVHAAWAPYGVWGMLKGGRHKQGSWRLCSMWGLGLVVGFKKARRGIAMSRTRSCSTFMCKSDKNIEVTCHLWCCWCCCTCCSSQCCCRCCCLCCLVMPSKIWHSHLFARCRLTVSRNCILGSSTARNFQVGYELQHPNSARCRLSLACRTQLPM